MDENQNGIPEEYEDVDLLTLTDEEGVEHEFEVADDLELDGMHYVALIPNPASDDELLAEDGNLVIMKYGVDEGGEEFLALIEDDDEFFKVSDMFLERLKDQYDFE